MGICASCLGWNKEEDEGDSTNPLLFDDPTTNYGSLSLPEHTPPASTVADARIDKELESIVSLAAQKLLPIYDFPDHHEGQGIGGQGVKQSTYGDLVKKFSQEDLGELEGVEDGWGSESDDEGDMGGGGANGGSNGGPSYAQVVKRDRPDIGPCTTTLKAEEGR